MRLFVYKELDVTRSTEPLRYNKRYKALVREQNLLAVTLAAVVLRLRVAKERAAVCLTRLALLVER